MMTNDHERTMLEAEQARYNYLRNLLPSLDVVVESDDSDVAAAKIINAKLIIAEMEAIPIRMKAILDGVVKATGGNR